MTLMMVLESIFVHKVTSFFGLHDIPVQDNSVHGLVRTTDNPVQGLPHTGLPRTMIPPYKDYPVQDKTVQDNPVLGFPRTRTTPYKDYPIQNHWAQGKVQHKCR